MSISRWVKNEGLCGCGKRVGRDGPCYKGCCNG